MAGLVNFEQKVLYIGVDFPNLNNNLKPVENI
jgi:hypothetical protein